MNRIKTVIILTAVLFTGVLSISCSSDDDKTPEATIIGVWKDTSIVYETFVNNISQGKKNQPIDENNYEIITFNIDNTFSKDVSESDIDANNNVIIEVNKLSGIYSVKGNKLYLTYDPGDKYEETIERGFKLENNQLITMSTYEYTENGEEKKNIYTTTYKRQ